MVPNRVGQARSFVFNRLHFVQQSGGIPIPEVHHTAYSSHSAYSADHHTLAHEFKLHTSIGTYHNLIWGTMRT